MSIDNGQDGTTNGSVGGERFFYEFTNSVRPVSEEERQKLDSSIEEDLFEKLREFGSEMFPELAAELGTSMNEEEADKLASEMATDIMAGIAAALDATVERFDRASLEQNETTAGAIKRVPSMRPGVYPITNVDDGQGFFTWLIGYVPDGSIWALDGLCDGELFALLHLYATEDDMEVYHTTEIPEAIQVKVRLDQKSKPEILDHLRTGRPGNLALHHHIYHGESGYFSAYDNLSIVQLSRLIPATDLEMLDRKNIITLSPGRNL